MKFIVPLLISLILWGLNINSNPENRKSHLSRLLACLFFSGFVFLLSSCKSLLWALLWQVKIKRSHRHWQPRGPHGGRRHLWSYSIPMQQHPRPGQSSQLPAKHTFRANWGQRRNQPLYRVLILLSTISWMINGPNERLPNLPVFLSFQGEDCPVTRILLADEWSCLWLTSAAS